MRLLQILAIGLAVVASGQTPTPPVATTYKGHDALDYWVGEWDVFMGGQKVGSSVIEKTLKGFGITEHWTSARGGQGRSFFVFDAADGTWRQLWISDTGWIVQKTGKPIQDGISLEGESKYPNGKKTKSREKLTKNADGSVRQLIEDYDEATKKWTVGFDGKYVRKGER